MFNYKEYETLIKYISKKLPIMDYSQISDNTKSFFIIRHDVEFYLENAYDLAYFEKENLGINSTYFFQIRNNCYNLFSNKNIKIVHDINKMGHRIGLHAHMDALTDNNKIEEYIINDIDILQNVLNIPIDRFSFHRPKRKHLEMNLKIEGIINAYENKYFTFSDNLLNLDVVYLADSNHKWKYGYPLDVDLNLVKKVQLLAHPYSWSKDGNDNLENFRCIVDKKITEIKKSINSEIKNFPKELL